MPDPTPAAKALYGPSGPRGPLPDYRPARGSRRGHARRAARNAGRDHEGLRFRAEARGAIRPLVCRWIRAGRCNTSWGLIQINSPASEDHTVPAMPFLSGGIS